MSVDAARSQAASRSRALIAGAARGNAPIVLIYSLVLVVMLVGSVLSPEFPTLENATDVLRQSIVLGLVTIGQLGVILAGGIDMSVGMAARAVGLGVAMAMAKTGVPPGLLIVVGLGAGVLIGILNGSLIAGLGAQPFIVTLGTMTVLYGVALGISSGPTPPVPDFLPAAYEASIGPVPVSVIVMGFVWLGAWLVLSRTRFGRNIYAIGGSLAVARLAGIRTTRTQIAAYAISGFLAAMAGLFLLARSGLGSSNMADGLEFQSVVAAAVGGVSLYGGRGSVLGALGAVLLISVTANAMNLLEVSGYYQTLFLGLIVIAAVAIYRPERWR